MVGSYEYPDGVERRKEVKVEKKGRKKKEREKRFLFLKKKVQKKTNIFKSETNVSKVLSYRSLSGTCLLT